MAKGKIGIGGQWSDELIEVLNEFVEEEEDIIKDCFKQASGETCEMVKSTSPKESGDYAASWTVKTESSGMLGKDITFIVHNDEHYRLTHLLEKGHQSYNQFGGSYKRVGARRHIKPAERFGNELLLSKLHERL